MYSYNIDWVQQASTIPKRHLLYWLTFLLLPAKWHGNTCSFGGSMSVSLYICQVIQSRLQEQKIRKSLFPQYKILIGNRAWSSSLWQIKWCDHHLLSLECRIQQIIAVYDIWTHKGQSGVVAVWGGGNHPHPSVMDVAKNISKARVNCMTELSMMFMWCVTRMRGCRAGRRNVGRFHQRRNYHTRCDTRNMSKPDNVSSAKLDNASVTMASLHYVTIFQPVSSCCTVAFWLDSC